MTYDFIKHLWCEIAEGTDGARRNSKGPTGWRTSEGRVRVQNPLRLLDGTRWTRMNGINVKHTGGTRGTTIRKCTSQRDNCGIREYERFAKSTSMSARYEFIARGKNFHGC
jgi:hypothetical protein